MEFSYELSKKEDKIGSPEKPLSDLGAVGYRSYWANALLKILKAHQGGAISIIDISCTTSILPEDIVGTLTMLGLLKKVTPIGSNTIQHIIHAPPALLDELIAKYPENKLRLDPRLLHWAPFYVMDPKKDKWSIQTLRVTAGSSLTRSSASLQQMNTLAMQDANRSKASSDDGQDVGMAVE